MPQVLKRCKAQVIIFLDIEGHCGISLHRGEQNPNGMTAVGSDEEIAYDSKESMTQVLQIPAPIIEI